jgi:hypothetical protein
LLSAITGFHDCFHDFGGRIPTGSAAGGMPPLLSTIHMPVMPAISIFCSLEKKREMEA